MNPTVTMTAMAKVGWSDPAKAGPMLDKIPLGRFAEVRYVRYIRVLDLTKW